MRAWRVIRSLTIAYAFGCLVLAICLGELAFRPQRVPVRSRKSAEAMAERFGARLEDIEITVSDHTVLRAWFARPSISNGTDVILLHGVGDNRQGMMGFAELFLSKGFAVLVPDSRAQGESGGDFPTYGLKESEDVHRWIDWLVNRQPANCVFGMGESMGASILLQAVQGEDRFCAIVAESPFASFRQIAYVRVGQFFHTGSWLGRVALRPAVEMAFFYGRVTRGVYLPSASPENSVIGSRVPILLIHGLSDENIPFQQSEDIWEHNSADISFWEVPGAGHCGAVNVVPLEFNSRVVGWFASHR